MQTKPTIFLHDRFVEPEQATVSIFDRGYLFGDGLFETLRSYGGRLFRPRAHLERLIAGAERLAMPLPMSASALEAALLATVDRFGAEDANVRITLSRGPGAGGISITGAERATLSIVARSLSRYPADAYARGIASGTADTRKVPPQCLPSGLKTANYLSNILARRELDARNMLEGVQLSLDGRAVSGTVSNVFMVREGRLVTPDLPSGCRDGVTRAALLELAAHAHVAAEVRPIDAAELTTADEIFFANTIMECLPVSSFDGRALPTAPGPITRTMHSALRAAVKQETTSHG